ncbi:MAG: hypothetical protein WCD18_10150 [Thermosynechococcaceae cyanobacterium]
MPRADLLALTLDDLTVLSNRGLVKRAQRELESAEFTYQYAESDDGTVTLRWSDDFDCTLPANRVICDRHCTCTATTICRHLIRSVLAYQRQFAVLTADPLPAAQPDNDTSVDPSNQPWNPGEISDSDLAQHFKATQLKQLQRQFDTNQVIELMCGIKPTARLHSSGHTLRFLVPGDLRYTYCDCAAPAPCSHVPLAIWAFRQLQPGQKSGIISTETLTEPAPIALLDDIEAALCELIKTGLRGLSDALFGRLQRLEQHCRSAVLIWPAEILVELLQECDRYRQRDARFSSSHVVELIGELCIRMDAIRNATVAVPQRFIRGTQNDRVTELGAARLIGLGCGVQTHQQNIRLTSYFQDTDSGAVMAFSRNFTDVPSTQAEPPKEFWQFAQTKVLKQTSMEQIGAGQLLLKSGKRSPDFQLLPGRSQIIINPQTFQWESLRAPLLVDNFADLQDRLRLLPPSSLSPRRQTETLQVFSVHRVKSVDFCVVEQAVVTELEDSVGNEAKLFFPYHHRAHLGVDTLISSLTQMTPLFIAGNVYLKLNQVVIIPISLVFQADVSRILLQPWIHSNRTLISTVDRVSNLTQASFNSSRLSIERYFSYCLEVVSEIILVGTENNGDRAINLLQNLYKIGLKIGLTNLLDPIKQIILQSDQDAHPSFYDQTLVEYTMLKLMLILRLSQDYLC